MTDRERVLSERIERTERALDNLYRQRAGSLIQGYPGLGWCCVCGRHQVEYREGFDTCQECAPRV